jgi:outer membrane protein TolC
MSSVACSPSLPRVQGAPAVSSAPSRPWTPIPREPVSVDRALELPADFEARRQALRLDDLVDLALRNNPATRVAWASARAAAAEYGSVRGTWFPTATLDVDATRLKTAGTQGRVAVQQTVYGPTVNLTWLVFGFGRAPSITSAREALIAANWTHNASIQDAVLDVGRAYYLYSSDRSLVAANRTSLTEAETNLAAAEERRRVGVATIADVLQARTAVEQARLTLQGSEGDLAAAKGSVAVSAGFPVALPFEVDTLADVDPIGRVGDEVDSLIAIARRGRPDLLAADAAVAQARADARVAAAERLPSLTATGNAGSNYINGVSGARNTYTVALGLSIPLFNGFSWEFDAKAARARAEAAEARAQQLRRGAELEVFTAYFAVRTATERVRTAEALIAAADQSAAAARGRYRAGVGTLLELLTAENVLISARSQRIQARFGWRTSLIQLAHDAGLLDTGGRLQLQIVPDSSRNGPPR